MNMPWLVASTVLSALNLIVLVLLWARARSAMAGPSTLRPLVDGAIAETRRVEESLRIELGRQREEAGRAATSLREELSLALRSGLEGMDHRHDTAQRAAEQRLDALREGLGAHLQVFGDSSDQRLSRLRQELNEAAARARSESREHFGQLQRAMAESMQASGEIQRSQLAEFAQRLERLTTAVNQQFEQIRLNLERRLDQLQQRNEARLEEMRRTVDEKLESTLERRLGESFKLVSERLEQVHKGLGEMQAMATSVGDLKRVLTNVKTRGTWGEIQLGALLEEILTPDQYAANVAPKPGSPDRVEFAIRLPGHDPADAPVWLPVDAKFPQEDYLRLLDAAERADAEGVAEAGRALESRLRNQARDIHFKYVEPPCTTDFAILFLPSEGLYAEALRRPGLADGLQRDYRVLVAGPTTLAALLNSLQIGFRTLAIQQRSGEVWSVLAAVKTEFGKFGEVLGRVKRKLDEASTHLEQTEVRTRAIHRRLRAVEELPGSDAEGLLPLGDLCDEGSSRDEAAPEN
jgi:DNA recombination protein RmuC